MKILALTSALCLQATTVHADGPYAFPVLGDLKTSIFGDRSETQLFWGKDLYAKWAFGFDPLQATKIAPGYDMGNPFLQGFFEFARNAGTGDPDPIFPYQADDGAGFGFGLSFGFDF